MSTFYRAPFIEAAVASVLYDAGAIANLMTALPNGIYTIATAVVILRTSILPRWLAYEALLVGAIHASALPHYRVRERSRPAVLLGR